MRKGEDGAGSLSSARSFQTPQQVFHSGLRRSEISQRKSSCRRSLELKLCDPAGDAAVRVLSPAVLAAGASQELCLGFLGSQDLSFAGNLSQAWCTQGCGHRKCIHACSRQSGAPRVSDVLLGRVVLWGCDDGTPSCFPNKTSLLLPGVGFPWPCSHALSLDAGSS